jgi:hypothetical protein
MSESPEDDCISTRADPALNSPAGRVWEMSVSGAWRSQDASL